MVRNVDNSNVSFEVLQHSTNFLFLFKKLHPNVILNAHEIELMQLLTLYECAVKEQSFLKFFKPTLNDRFLATTSTKLTFLEDTTAAKAALVSSSAILPSEVKIELEQDVPKRFPIADSNISITDTNYKIDISD